jgi:drug/metabolite transporter (DMT)-like permease
MHKPRSFQAVDAALLALTVVWGANYAIVKNAMAQVEPLAFNAIRFCGGTAVILTLAWLVEHDLSLPRREWKLVFLLGLIGHFAHLVTFITGISRTTATNSSLIISSAPIFVALLGTLDRSEHMRARNWLGILLSFLGMFLVVTAAGPELRLQRQTVVGDLLSLASAILWAIYLVLSRRLLQRVSALRATAWTMVAAAPLLVLVALPGLCALDWRTLSGAAWFGMAYSGILTIGVGNVVWYVGVQKIGGARASLYSYVTPLVTVAVAWMLLGELLKPLQALGALGVLLGIARARQRGGA